MNISKEKADIIMVDTSGRSHNNDLLLDYLSDTFVGIVDKVSCAVITFLYALTAADTLIMIYHGDKSAVLKLFCHICLGGGTFSDAGIAADALFRFYDDQFTHNYNNSLLQIRK